MIGVFEFMFITACFAGACDVWRVAELVAKAKETGWVSTGKTPEQTLYSGIFREMKEKGEASRFKKSATCKGSFEANT